MSQRPEFCDMAGAVTPIAPAGYMQLVDSDYIDDKGVEHVQEAPEGMKRADHICWNGRLDHVQELIATLSSSKRYDVLIAERN